MAPPPGRCADGVPGSPSTWAAPAPAPGYPAAGSSSTSPPSPSRAPQATAPSSAAPSSTPRAPPGCCCVFWAPAFPASAGTGLFGIEGERRRDRRDTARPAIPRPAPHQTVAMAAQPLRRPTDLVQAWIGLALTLAVLAATPLAMVLVGTIVHRSLQQTADEQAQSRHRTPAVLLHDAPATPNPDRRKTGTRATRSRSASPTPPDTPEPPRPKYGPACPPRALSRCGPPTAEKSSTRPGPPSRSAAAPSARPA